ncbi:MAG: response regulator [Aquabacterium sp.]|nr:response regulator [Aquabacterium sp.]
MATGRLLVLDDDATVGQILVAGAQTMGFQARQFLDAPSFLDCLRSWEPTHVAIDLTLPGTSGAEVLHQVAQTGSRARVIICSGSDPGALDSALGIARELGLTTAGTLAKPFRLAALRQLLTLID